MNQYTARKGDYMPVGNITMDTITAAINHYRHFGRKVKKIRLNNAMWKKFNEYMKTIDEAYKPRDEFSLDGVVDITKGSILQIRQMEFEFYEITAQA